MIALVGPPLFLALIAVYLVFLAFGDGYSIGVRSLAGILLPVVIGSFLYVFKKELLQRLAAVSTLTGFLGGLILGLLVMAVLRLFAHGTGVPVAEVIVAGCFSVLVFSSAAAVGNRGLSQYYGVMCGILLYVIAFGFPVIGLSGK
jgi:hypothetical protein